MKYDYYLHRSGGVVFDYFGGVGTPFRVSAIKGIISKLLGYRVTRVRKGVPIRRVMIRAILAAGVHRHSYKMERFLTTNEDTVH